MDRLIKGNINNLIITIHKFISANRKGLLPSNTKGIPGKNKCNWIEI